LCKEQRVSKLKLILVLAGGVVLWAAPSPVLAQAQFLPGRPNYLPIPPQPPTVGIVGSGAFFLLGPRYQAQQRAQAAEFRTNITRLQQTQAQLQQQLEASREEDIDAYLLSNGTLLGRRAATFDDTRGAFPSVELPRRRALGPRTTGGRR
jgi:hypothetical protein